MAHKLNYEIKQLDVETAFLYGELSEDIYIKISAIASTDIDTGKRYLWKLNKSLYNLKVSPEKWNNKFSGCMRRLGFQLNDVDPCVFF